MPVKIATLKMLNRQLVSINKSDAHFDRKKTSSRKRNIEDVRCSVIVGLEVQGSLRKSSRVDVTWRIIDMESGVTNRRRNPAEIKRKSRNAIIAIVDLAIIETKRVSSKDTEIVTQKGPRSPAIVILEDLKNFHVEIRKFIIKDISIHTQTSNEEFYSLLTRN